MDGLVLHRVSKSFQEKKVLEDISFEVKLGEIVALLGPSGCGKSTTLSLIVGLLEPDQGDIVWQGKSLKGIPPHLRNFGLMFQDLALFPHLKVFENIAFGLRLRKIPALQIQQRVKQILDLVNLQGYEERDVANLSGGEMQRVALARALAPQPQLLMLDEPLASLDRTLKDRLTIELRHILRKMNQTAIYVTHDQEEAFMVADRVIVMNDGRIEQDGSPQEIYQQPASPFVAQFLGMKNFVQAELVADQGKTWLVLPFGKIPYMGVKQGKGIALLRPEGADLNRDGELKIEGPITQKLFRGDHSLIEIRWDEKRFTFILPCSKGLPEEGERVVLSIFADSILFFPASDLRTE